MHQSQIAIPIVPATILSKVAVIRLPVVESGLGESCELLCKVGSRSCFNGSFVDYCLIVSTQNST